MKRFIFILIIGLLLFTLFGCKKNPRVTIELENGKNVIIELFQKDAPGTVKNFLKLVDKKFYDGLTFHRVEKGFVVQGGDPRGNGTGGPGYKIKYEASGRQHVTGAVAMARKKSLDSAGSQFYICLSPQEHLNGKYTVFGIVISGMDEVGAIERGDVMKKVYISN
jgi:peptidyl-prolyl cis-trans isomerase B (cyclophilin B)